MRAIVLFFLISGMLTACKGNDNRDTNKVNSTDKLQVVSSIKPIQAIVLAIAGEHIHSEQLIPDYASPHSYSFKPSDIRKIDNADIIFRIDEHMETQLNGVLNNLETNKPSIISLAEVNGIMLLKADHRHQDDEHHHDQKQQHSHEHDKDHDHQHENHNQNNHDNVDYHIWTSPKNAVLMANQIAKSLKAKDSKNTKQYQKNVESFFQQVKTESDKIATKLAPYKNKPYIVFHNSWQYFAAEFGLKKPIVIELHEGISSGAKTINEIRDKIVKENINCVFYNPSINIARLTVLAEKVKTVEIDVLAKNIELDQSSYINWLHQLGNQIESCLSK